MGLPRKAGSIVLDRLRDRILVGRYFGRYAPGDRLPSVRDIARFEAVDRKTAAAAYRRLQREGLVRIEPRSGVYLGADPAGVPAGPLRRMHAQWLENALATASELGLTAPALVRMLQAVAHVQGQRIAVVDPEPEHAALLARELAVRTGLDFIPCAPGQLLAASGPFRATPFAVASPIATLRLRSLRDRIPVVQATLAPELLEQVARDARQGPVTVVVGTDGLGHELQRALDHTLVEATHRVAIARARGPRPPDNWPLARSPDRVVLWPGSPSGWAAQVRGDFVRDMQGAPLVSPATLARLRGQIATLALDRLSTSSVA